jgi:hypothetical protein
VAIFRNFVTKQYNLVQCFRFFIYRRCRAYVSSQTEVLRLQEPLTYWKKASSFYFIFVIQRTTSNFFPFCVLNTLNTYIKTTTSNSLKKHIMCTIHGLISIFTWCVFHDFCWQFNYCTVYAIAFPLITRNSEEYLIKLSSQVMLSFDSVSVWSWFTSSLNWEY